MSAIVATALTIKDGRTEGKEVMTECSDDEFRRMVAYNWLEEDDPTRFVGWDAERCKRLMPAFYEAWEKVGIYIELASLAAKDAKANAEEDDDEDETDA
jgi:hypothetical protein